MKLLKSYVLAMLITAATIFSMTDEDIESQSSKLDDLTASFSHAATTSGISNNLPLNAFDEEESVFVGITSSDYSPRTLHSMIRPSKKPSAIVELCDFNKDEEDKVSFAMDDVVNSLKTLVLTLEGTSLDNV